MDKQTAQAPRRAIGVSAECKGVGFLSCVLCDGLLGVPDLRHCRVRSLRWRRAQQALGVPAAS